MKREPRPAIHREKQLGQVCYLGGVKSLGIFKAGQTVLARLMESQKWYQLDSSVGGGFRKGTMSSAHLMPGTSVSPCMHWCLSSCYPGAGAQGDKSVKVSPCVASLRGAAWRSRVSSTNSILTGFCNQKLWWLIFLALESWAKGHGVGLWLLAPEVSLLNFYPPHMRWEQPRPHLPPSYQAGWL